MQPHAPSHCTDVQALLVTRTPPCAGSQTRSDEQIASTVSFPCLVLMVFNPKALLITHTPYLFVFLTPHTFPGHPLEQVCGCTISTAAAKALCWATPDCPCGELQMGLTPGAGGNGEKGRVCCYWMLLIMMQTCGWAGGLREEPGARGAAEQRASAIGTASWGSLRCSLPGTSHIFIAGKCKDLQPVNSVCFKVCYELLQQFDSPESLIS